MADRRGSLVAVCSPLGHDRGGRVAEQRCGGRRHGRRISARCLERLERLQLRLQLGHVWRVLNADGVPSSLGVGAHSSASRSARHAASASSSSPSSSSASSSSAASSRSRASCSLSRRKTASRALRSTSYRSFPTWTSSSSVGAPGRPGAGGARHLKANRRLAVYSHSAPRCAPPCCATARRMDSSGRPCAGDHFRADGPPAPASWLSASAPPAPESPPPPPPSSPSSSPLASSSRCRRSKASTSAGLTSWRRSSHPSSCASAYLTGTCGSTVHRTRYCRRPVGPRARTMAATNPSPLGSSPFSPGYASRMARSAGSARIPASVSHEYERGGWNSRNECLRDPSTSTSVARPTMRAPCGAPAASGPGATPEGPPPPSATSRVSNSESAPLIRLAASLAPINGATSRRSAKARLRSSIGSGPALGTSRRSATTSSRSSRSRRMRFAPPSSSSMASSCVASPGPAAGCSEPGAASSASSSSSSSSRSESCSMSSAAREGEKPPPWVPPPSPTPSSIALPCCSDCVRCAGAAASPPSPASSISDSSMASSLPKPLAPASPESSESTDSWPLPCPPSKSSGICVISKSPVNSCCAASSRLT